MDEDLVRRALFGPAHARVSEKKGSLGKSEEGDWAVQQRLEACYKAGYEKAERVVGKKPVAMLARQLDNGGLVMRMRMLEGCNPQEIKFTHDPEGPGWTMDCFDADGFKETKEVSLETPPVLRAHERRNEGDEERAAKERAMWVAEMEDQSVADYLAAGSRAAEEVTGESPYLARGVESPDGAMELRMRMPQGSKLQEVQMCRNADREWHARGLSHDGRLSKWKRLVAAGGQMSMAVIADALSDISSGLSLGNDLAIAWGA